MNVLRLLLVFGLIITAGLMATYGLTSFLSTVRASVEIEPRP